MKKVLKTIVVGLVVMSLSFSPALMGMAMADGINYEGFSSYKKDNSWGYDDQTRGAMLNFSFGGPKDYKKNSSLQDIYEASLTTNQKVGIGLGVVGLLFFIIIMGDDDECKPYLNGKADLNLRVPPGYCEPRRDS